MVKIIKYNFAEINANPLKYIIEKDYKEKDILSIESVQRKKLKNRK